MHLNDSFVVNIFVLFKEYPTIGFCSYYREVGIIWWPGATKREDNWSCQGGEHLIDLDLSGRFEANDSGMIQASQDGDGGHKTVEWELLAKVGDFLNLPILEQGSQLTQ